VTYKEAKHLKSAWVSRKKTDSKITKPWGYEIVWSGFSGVHGKSLFIESGKRTSLKYNKMKSEVLMVKSGKVRAEYGDELTISDPLVHPMQTSILEPGDSLLVQSAAPYRITAIEDSEIIEIGNNLSDSPVRLEDDYGRC
tara:strand:- start:161 stop:580 length:420 start_codon:yes stop_codon:yes gene_type:complete